MTKIFKEGRGHLAREGTLGPNYIRRISFFFFFNHMLFHHMYPRVALGIKLPGRDIMLHAHRRGNRNTLSVMYIDRRSESRLEEGKVTEERLGNAGNWQLRLAADRKLPALAANCQYMT